MATTYLLFCLLICWAVRFRFASCFSFIHKIDRESKLDLQGGDNFFQLNCANHIIIDLSTRPNGLLCDALRPCFDALSYLLLFLNIFSGILYWKTKSTLIYQRRGFCFSQKHVCRHQSRILKIIFIKIIVSLSIFEAKKLQILMRKIFSLELFHAFWAPVTPTSK